jgi:myosin heavy subunit
LFNIIDEETKIPKGSDEGFLTKALKQHHHRNHKDNKLTHEPHKMTATQFSIHHYAGQVTYDSSGFLNKNKDKLSDGCIHTMMIYFFRY